MLDQTRLPGAGGPCSSARSGRRSSTRSARLAIRGAPGHRRSPGRWASRWPRPRRATADLPAARAEIARAAAALRAARPTAVNLAWAVDAQAAPGRRPPGPAGRRSPPALADAARAPPRRRGGALPADRGPRAGADGPRGAHHDPLQRRRPGHRRLRHRARRRARRPRRRPLGARGGARDPAAAAGRPGSRPGSSRATASRTRSSPTRWRPR